MSVSSEHKITGKKAKNQHKQTICKLQNVLDSVPTRIFWKDLDGRYLGCNRLFANDAGLDSVEDIIGKLDSELVWAEHAEQYRADDKKVIKSTKPRLYYEESQTRPNGKEIWVETSKIPLTDDIGAIIGIVGTYSDITEKKRIAEQAENLGNVLERSLNEIYIFDAKSLKFIHVNEGALKNIDYPLEEMLEMTPLDIKPEFSPERFATLVKPLRKNQQKIIVFETVHQRKDGSIYPVEVHLQLQNYQGLPAFVAIILDISVQKITQTALHYIVKGTASNTGEDFFKSLIANLAQMLDCGYAFIGLLDKQDPEIIRINKVFVLGDFADNFDYPLKGTPCQHTIGDGACLYREKVQSAFPNDNLLIDFGIECYAGVSIKNANGFIIGLLVIMDTKPMEHANTKLSLIQLFADRCGAEFQRLETEAALKSSEARFKHINEATGAYIWEVTSDAIYTFITGQVLAVKGRTSEELLGRSPFEFMPDDDIESTRRIVQKAIDTKGTFELAHSNVAADGSILWEEVRGTVILDVEDNVIGLHGTGISINERKEAEAQIERLAFYDPLTNLPNRRLFLDRLQQDLTLAARQENFGALLYLDLDHFKTINDALGHSVGDTLLQQVAKRLGLQLRAADTVARLGGDEFVILLPELDQTSDLSAKQAYKVAQKIRETLCIPFDLDGHEYTISSSIGITLFPEPDQTTDIVLKQADSAMYKSKNDGRNTISFYVPSMQIEANARLTLEKNLRQAISQNELELYYQIQVNEQDTVIGAEALLRWNHPENGIVRPDIFIPLAEETGLIFDIGDWVLYSACQQMNQWTDDCVGKLPQLSINVSSRQFRQVDFIEKVLQIIEQTGANPNHLVLEITEGIIIENIQDTIYKMLSLKETGLSFSIDDFGVGYSSLSYLRQLPLDELKIDRTFIQDIETDPSSAAIVETIISMAQHMELGVIAEGVENQIQIEFLKNKGCLSYQGHYFSHPIPAKEFTDLLKTR
jgi:diguanylate cyclase (GGDEF)-like protein/PAS domain S-box-containing protein